MILANEPFGDICQVIKTILVYTEYKQDQKWFAYLFLIYSDRLNVIMLAIIEYIVEQFLFYNVFIIHWCKGSWDTCFKMYQPEVAGLFVLKQAIHFISVIYQLINKFLLYQQCNKRGPSLTAMDIVK